MQAADISRRVIQWAAQNVAPERELPIQCSIDIAAPVDVVYDEWRSFDFLPEGTHRVEDVEPDGDGHLVGHVNGHEWEAEIVDERIDESFGWHSISPSDCSGLATFHELSPSLTRIELHLDVVPGGISDAVTLWLKVADRRAHTELRRFKAYVEAIDPDEYPPPPEPEEDEDDEAPEDDEQ